jgi:hypothetical protein
MAIAILRGREQLADVTAALAGLGIGPGELSLIGASQREEPIIGQPPRPGDGAAYLADIGEVAVPGLGSLIASGPLLATLAGAVVDDPRPTFSGLSRRLIACGVDESQARRHEGLVRGGGILVCAHVAGQDLAERAVAAMTRHGAVDPVVCRDDPHLPDMSATDA